MGGDIKFLTELKSLTHEQWNHKTSNGTKTYGNLKSLEKAKTKKNVRGHTKYTDIEKVLQFSFLLVRL